MASRAVVARRAAGAAGRRAVACGAAASERKLWAPGVEAPPYLDGSLAGDFGWDPLGLGADPVALRWYRQAELIHARWAMLGTAGILVQEFAFPDQFWYEAALPENLPAGLPAGLNLGSLLFIEFWAMHWVEVQRWQEYKKPGTAEKYDIIFPKKGLDQKGDGYPGGVFNPLNLAKGDELGKWQYREIVNGRLAMFAFVGMTLQAQATGLGPLASIWAHQADPFGTTIASNFIGGCKIPNVAHVYDVDIPLTCLFPTEG